MQLNMLDLVGQLADMKEIDCKNTMAIAVLIELLIDKGYFTRQEFTKKASQLENDTLAEILLMRKLRR
ncbi:hypothetical protein SDC9_13544 [bioreactor metagenome]|uniref:Uncharacterized protein n=1 Tax=bioreactor metagenome TaxID=1076179 RepID=A0A644TQA2_9ZZZZ